MRFETRRLACALGVAGLIVVGAPAAVAQDGPATAPTATSIGARTSTELRLELLRDRWTTSADNRDRAPEVFASLQRSGSYVPADDYLYGLVRFNHNQYDEAVAAFDRALERDPNDAMFLKTRVWVALARKKYDAAWPALKAYQSVLFAEAKDPKRTAETRATDLRFLGQVHAFLSEPAERLDDREPLVELRDAVAANLPLEDLRIFEAAEREALDKYASLVAERDRTAEESANAADDAVAAVMDEYDAERDQLKAERAQLEPQRAEIVNAANAELTEMAASRLQLQQATAVLSNQIPPLRAEYSRALESIERLRGSFARIDFRDNIGNTIIAQQMANAQQQIAALESQLQISERQFAQASSQLLNLNREFSVKELSHRQKLAEVDRDLRRIEADLKKLDRDEEKELGKRPGGANAARLMSQKIGAVDSYVDFDLEIPRLRLIEFLERR